jgi:hypothetical protein
MIPTTPHWLLHLQVFAAGEDTAMAPLTPAINQALAGSPPQDHPSLLQKFGEQYLTAMRAKLSAASSSQHPHIVDKMLRNMWLVGYIHMLLPNACILHVARHPMDVAMSCYAQPFGYSTSALAWAWDLSSIASQLEMTWELAEHWEQQLPGRVQTGEVTRDMHIPLSLYQRQWFPIGVLTCFLMVPAGCAGACASACLTLTGPVSKAVAAGFSVI